MMVKGTVEYEISLLFLIPHRNLGSVGFAILFLFYGNHIHVVNSNVVDTMHEHHTSTIIQ